MALSGARLSIAATTLVLAACGREEEPGKGAAPPSPGASASRETTATCGDITFTPNSGDGAFEVEVKGIGCAEAERLLRSDRVLKRWDCTRKQRYPAGNGRYRCREGGREITFTTGV